MKCPACDGTGHVYNALGDFEEDCGYCHGTGNVVEPHTNEAWFCSLSTEEKVKWLSRHSQFIYGCGEKHAMPKIMYEEDWETWLKEKHE